MAKKKLFNLSINYQEFRLNKGDKVKYRLPVPDSPHKGSIILSRESQIVKNTQISKNGVQIIELENDPDKSFYLAGHFTKI